MHIQHTMFSVLSKAKHWKCALLCIDNYMYISSFDNSFMLRITSLSLLIFPLKRGISPFLGAVGKGVSK